MRTVRLTKESTKDILENLLKRSPNNYGKFESAVADILAQVKEKGDEALFTFTREFDKVDITPETIRVTEEEIQEAYQAVDASLLEVIKKALVNIRSYHEKQRQNSWFTSDRKWHHAWPEGNSSEPCRRLCAGRKGSISFLCTDEYCSCKGCRSSAYCYDHTSRKGWQGESVYC